MPGAAKTWQAIHRGRDTAGGGMSNILGIMCAGVCGWQDKSKVLPGRGRGAWAHFMMAPAMRKVPASMRSGLMRWRAPWSLATPWTWRAGGAWAFHLCAHGVEQGGEVGDFGLAGAVLEEGVAIGEGCDHEEVFGAGDGDLVEDDVRAVEAVGAGFEVAVVLGDGGTHSFEALDVQVDGTAADGASAGHGDARDAGAGDERAEDEGVGAHGFDDLVLGDGVGEDGAADVGAVLGAAVAKIDLGAHGGEQAALGLDVADLGDVLQDDFVFGEDGGGHAGQGGVLCAGDFDGAEEGIASANDKLVHGDSLREWLVGR